MALSDLLVDARDLRFRYADGTLALDGVSFQQRKGEHVALLGANGSGKTTFALHLNGTLRGEGELLVSGVPVTPAYLPEIRRKVAFLFQDPNDQIFMPTVLEDVAFGLLNSGVAENEAYDRARAALEHLGMSAAWRKPPHQLSSGEKQRVALAGLLVSDPELLVLDEPTSALDPPGARALLDLLEQIPATKLVITHDHRLAERLTQRAVFFEKGKIVASGPVQEVLRRFTWF